MAGINKLHDTTIKKAKAGDREYTLGDGGNLFLRIRPNGTKNWIFVYSHPHTKKRMKLGLGAYPDTSLTYARTLAKEYRNQLAQSIDPKIYREKLLLEHQIKHQNTFLFVAENFLKMLEDKEALKRKKLIDEAQKLARQNNTDFDETDLAKIHNKVRTSHRKRLFLKKNIYPALANMPITDITAPGVIKVIEPIAALGKLENVKRGCAIMNQIMNHAVNRSFVKFNPLNAIADVFVKPISQSMPTVEPKELGDVMRIMSNCNMKHVTRCAFEMQFHTLTRAEELASMRWCDINWDENLWTIPDFMTKMQRQHRIPLTIYTAGILQHMKAISGDDKYVFPSDKLGSKFPHISPYAVNSALQATPLKGKLVAHGLRSIGSTKLNSEKFDEDAIEVALSHLDKDRVRAAYNKNDYLEERQEIMNYWSEFIVQSTGKYYSIAGQYKPEDTIS